ncbi:hypothetical protein [Ferruginibacter profundus]
MENSFFIFTEKGNNVQLERFHLCTWEFNNNSSLVEFGFEISKESICKDELTISLFIPWAEKSCGTKDLYKELSIADNSRFIFNDSISATKYLKTNTTDLGVIHTFSGRNELCVLPAEITINEEKIVSATLNLKPYREYQQEVKPNVYFRFWVKPTMLFISMRKKGLNKSTIIYDIKVNERRNIPDNKIKYFDDKEFCKIKYCFSFNILPNKYDIVFFDTASLKNVRTLEYNSFNKYLGDKRVKKDELIVVFNKKEVKDFAKKEFAESFSFFSIYSMERIGTGQFALAILVNIICDILFFIPSYHTKLAFSTIPFVIYLAFVMALSTFLYFIWPTIQTTYSKAVGWFKNLLKKNESTP